ncbi:hypothetical protein HMSSN036_70160 [Paenibacillus macerans]|nr:hypothetical protein HMSSN036_70160 [Paenibacillus macerans]
MAQRLATEYVNASLRLSEVQMSQFIHKVYDPHVRQRVKVLENGGQEVVLEDDGGEEVHLPFDRKDGYYVCELSFRLEQPHLTNVMRLLFAAFKGSGMVTRIYNGFMMMYYYQEGRVRKIVEYSRDSYKLVLNSRIRRENWHASIAAMRRRSRSTESAGISTLCWTPALSRRMRGKWSGSTRNCGTAPGDCLCWRLEFFRFASAAASHP